MPQDKDFKRLVRGRMAATGERYTVARAALSPVSAPSSHRISAWLDQLGDPARAQDAYEALRLVPEASLRPAALRGLSHSNWRIRRRCCRLLDDLTLTPVSIAALTRCLDDGHPLVRRAAMHTLTCQHCKPDGCALDVRPLYERMAADSSWRVRSAVLHSLTWAVGPAPWASDLVRRFAESDPSDKLRAVARAHLDHLDMRRRSNEQRLLLPPELRAKTERHPGRWVAIAGSMIVGVDDPRAFRHARRTMPDAVVYWVAPRFQ